MGDPNDFQFKSHWFDIDDEKQSLKYDKTFEKQKSFQKALFYLADHFNIAWRDLHEQNVMVRPSTRDYVAVDIGLFKI